MKEHPILFNAESVRAILDGRKTQTRRVIKPQPPSNAHFAHGGDLVRFWIPGSWYVMETPSPTYDREIKVPYQPGDRLWVRETHHIDWYPDKIKDAHGKAGAVHYRANTDVISQSWDGKWRPSIHMPRWASRLTLEMVDVRVERVQDISLDDIGAEGVDPLAWGESRNDGFAYCRAWEKLWNSINAKRGFGWDINPWVWVIEFREVKNGDGKGSNA